MNLRLIIRDFSDWLGDLIHFTPEGVGIYGTTSRSGYTPFATLFAFVVTQNGVLAIAEQLNIYRWVPLAIFSVVSVATILLIAILLRIKDGVEPWTFYYYDKGTITFGKFVLYMSITVSCIAGVAYYLGLFSPSKPQFNGELTMSKPVDLLTRIEQSRSIVDEALDPESKRTLEAFAHTLANGMNKAGRTTETSTAYVSWSRVPLGRSYNDFRCKLPEFTNPSSSLAFLYSSYPTNGGGTQAAYRLLYYDITQDRRTANTFQVRFPSKGDRILILFTSPNGNVLPEDEYLLSHEPLH